MALFSVPTQSQTKPEEGKTTYDEHLFRIIDEGALIHYCKRAFQAGDLDNPLTPPNYLAIVF